MMLPSLRPLVGMAVVASALLSGCSILPKSEPKTRYNLPATAMSPAGVSKNMTLYVATPQANRLLNSNHILVQPTGSEIQIYKGSQWADNVPVLIRDRFLLALNETQLFHAVTADAALNSNFALESRLSRFQVQYLNNQPTIVIELEAQLINRLNSSILSSKHFKQRLVAKSEQVSDIIDAFGQASDSLSVELWQWLKQQPHLN